MQSRQDLAQALRWCGQLLLLKTALDRAPSVSPAGLLAAVDALGTSYQVPGTLSSSFGPGREDGVAAVRAARYDDGCSCFVYSGAPQPVG